MPSVFPYTNGTATTDSFSDPLSTSPLNSPSHSSLHTDVNTAVETIETILQSGGGSRNLLYNGAMQVAQRGTSTASITASGYYTADRWTVGASSLGTWTQSVENDAPTGSGFRKSLKMLCTTADASPAGGDVMLIEQPLEGQDLQAIKKGTSSAQQLTLSFWVKANVTGTYIAELYDDDNARQTSKAYTISASGTWEFKTITFAADTTGAFNNDNGKSLACIFHLGAGSSWQSGTLQSTWATASLGNRAVGQVNVAAATNNYWQVTGVQLNVGAVAAPFEFKSYGQELRECQRYYYRLVTDGAAYARFCLGECIATTQANGVLTFPVTMRTAPTSIDQTGTASNYAVYSAATVTAGTVIPTLQTNGTNRNNLTFTIDVASGLTVGRAAQIISNNNTTSYIGISAEL